MVLYRPKQLQTKLEPSEVEYDGAAKKSDIQAWVKKNYHGLVGHRRVGPVCCVENMYRYRNSANTTKKFPLISLIN